MRAAIAVEPDALVMLTHLLRLCRDEHPVLWGERRGPVVPDPGELRADGAGGVAACAGRRVLDRAGGAGGARQPSWPPVTRTGRWRSSSCRSIGGSGRSRCGPSEPQRQREEINRLVGAAVTAGASIVVLPELSVTESLALELEEWLRRPDGPRLLVAGSYHHETDTAHETDPARDDDAPTSPPPGRRRNTALAWVRGADRPLVHDKHSPAESPVREDIRPQGWPELRIHVSADGWHLVIAICRDLLNPNAVHALTEAGANLVLVPAMSETLVAFGAPVAQLVGCDQALVVVANNPVQWSLPDQTVIRRAARAVFGHPGFPQQTGSCTPPTPRRGWRHAGALRRGHLAADAPR